MRSCILNLFDDTIGVPLLANAKISQKFIKPIVFGTVLLLLAISFAVLASPKTTYAATNQDLSFEGKIVSSTGTNITDGSYNVEFTIYTGCTNNTGTGCTAVWKEDYLTSNTTYSTTTPVVFTSGTFQTNLGSICPFTGGGCEGNTNTAINWDTSPLYVSINVGTTTACAAGFTSCGGGTGVMTPYILLTSSPYAMDAENADSLGGIAASSFVQLSPGSQQTGNINISGTVTSGAVNGITVGSTVQPSTAGALTVSSNGANALTLTSGAATTWSTSAGALMISSASTLDLQATGNVNIDTNNVANTVQIGNNANAVAQTINIGNTTNTASSTNTIVIGDTQGASSTTIQAGTGDLNLITNGASANTIVKDNTNSTTAFQVQNSAGAPILDVDTTDTTNLLTYPGFEVATGSVPTGWASVASPATFTQNTNTAFVYHGIGSLEVVTNATTGQGATTSSFTTAPISGSTNTVSFYAMLSSGTLAANALTVKSTDGTTHTCTGTIGGSGATTLNSNGFQRVSCTLPALTGTMTALAITTTTSGITLYIDAVQLQSGSTVTAYDLGGIQLRGVIENPLSLKSFTNSTSAFQIETTGGVNLLTADTLNGRIEVGSGNGGAGSTAPALLVLDDNSSGTDPTEVNGAMYYNVSLNQFRCGEQGGWIDCIGGMIQSNSAAGSAVNTCTTACAALYSNGSSTYLPANYCQAGRTLRIYASGTLSTFSTAPTLSLAFYQGTTATSDATDTLIGAASPAITTTASLASAPWSVSYTIVCYSTTSWNGSGTFILLNSTTSTAAASDFEFTSTSTTYGTAASNIYLFPIWGTSKSSNTITLNQWVVTGN
jgi:hypothetical protein